VDESNVFAAISTRSLRRVVEHLLGSHPEIVLASFGGDTTRIAALAARHRASVIVVDCAVLGAEPEQSVVTIRRSNPNAKLVVIDPFDWRRATAEEFLADTCLKTSAVARRLAPTVRQLTGLAKRQRPGGLQ
jgi:hypothetical protein